MNSNKSSESVIWENADGLERIPLFKKSFCCTFDVTADWHYNAGDRPTWSAPPSKFLPDHPKNLFGIGCSLVDREITHDRQGKYSVRTDARWKSDIYEKWQHLTNDFVVRVGQLPLIGSLQRPGCSIDGIDSDLWRVSLISQEIRTGNTPKVYPSWTR